jgi:hypothetical protein
MQQITTSRAASIIGSLHPDARGGKDSIDHPPGAHDDVANAVAGAIVTAARAADEKIVADLQAKGEHRRPGVEPADERMSALPPKADIALHRSECPLCAKSGH